MNPFSLITHTLQGVFGQFTLSEHYLQMISPYVVWFANRSNVTWACIFFTLLSVKGITNKMGRQFLQGNSKLPVLLNLQKTGFQLCEIVVTTAIVALFLYWVAIFMAGFIWYRSLAYTAWILTLSAPGLAIGLSLGVIASIALKRAIAKSIEPYYTQKLQTLKQTASDGQSDVRDVAKKMQESHKYDPVHYFKPDAIFVGLENVTDKKSIMGRLLRAIPFFRLKTATEEKKPIYIETSQFCRNHFQILGATGSGKSVVAISMLAQALSQGISAVVFDPKTGGDEFAPQVLRQICEEKGLTFTLCDLQKQLPQINLLDKDITQDELSELLQAGMGIQDKGGDGDYYRLKDRKAAHAGSFFAGKTTCFPHFDMLMHNKYPDLMEDADSFAEKLRLLSDVPAVKTETGVNLKEALDNGHCLYIIGSMRNPQVQLLQKMLLLRISQLIERRDRLQKHRHVTIFIDELKYFLTRPVLDALGTVRDHACNLLLGHQSIGDLADVTKDLNPVAVKGSVVGNSSIKILYKQNDDVEQKKAAALTGEKIVQRESTKRLSNLGVGEVIDTDERNTMSVPEALYSANYFSLLNPMVGVIVGLGLARLCFTSPIKVEKKPLPVIEYPECEDYLAKIVVVDDVSEPEFTGSKKSKTKKSKANTNTSSDTQAVQEVVTMPATPLSELNVMDDTLMQDTHHLLDMLNEPEQEEGA